MTGRWLAPLGGAALVMSWLFVLASCDEPAAAPAREVVVDPVADLGSSGPGPEGDGADDPLERDPLEHDPLEHEAPSQDRAPAAAVAPSVAAPLAGLPDAPAAGCALGAAANVWPRAGFVDVVGAEGAFFVGGTASRDGAEEVFVVRVAPEESPRTLLVGALQRGMREGARRAAPSLALAPSQRGTRGAMALVDGEQRLRLVTFDPASVSGLTSVEIAPHASPRFAPALAARDDGWSVAWTDERATPMRVHAARLAPDGRLLEAPRDVTPAAGGAAAPAFVDGARDLVFLDPRAAMSVAHRVTVTPAGFGATSVVRPISLVAEPPEIAVARAGDVDWIGFTAVGGLATTAVGLSRLEPGASPPAPLVPGTGYGTLHVDAASLGRGAVFVADAPTAAPPASPRQVHLRVLATDGSLGPPLVVEGSASRARVATSGDTVAVVFTDASGVQVRVGRCAVSPSPAR